MAMGWNNSYDAGTTGDTGTTGTTDVITSVWNANSGTKVIFEPASTIQDSVIFQDHLTEVEKERERKSNGNGIHPRLYFKYVKSKLTKLEQARLTEDMEKLKKLIVHVKLTGQQALYEDFTNRLVFLHREREIAACGIEYILYRETIEKFMGSVRELEVKLCKVKDYSRVLPSNVSKKINRFKKLDLFDNYWILYLNHPIKKDIGDNVKKVEKELKTNKQKIKEKDPMLFGGNDCKPDKFYFILDWVDKDCDLTLDRFLQEVRKNDPMYELDKIPEMSSKLLKEILDETKKKQKRLENTKPGNYRDLMDEEDEENRFGSVTNFFKKVFRKK